ncbi:MAG: DUF4396 domain-containing protein [Bradyrhizobium sp.]
MPEFWFVMSMTLLLAGFIVAYPINWWMVIKGLKHGMMTVRRPAVAHDAHEPFLAARQPLVASPNERHAGHAKASRIEIAWMAVLSVAVLTLGIGAVAIIHGNL